MLVTNNIVLRPLKLYINEIVLRKVMLTNIELKIVRSFNVN